MVVGNELASLLEARGWICRRGVSGGVPAHQVEAIREMVMGGQVAPFYPWRG